VQVPSRRRPTPPILAALLAAVLAFAGGCRGKTEEGPWTAATLARMTLRDRVAQLVVMRVDQPADTMVRARAVGLGVGGILLAGGTARDARALADTLAAAQRLAPIVAAVLDRGAGGVLAGATAFPAPGAVGSGRGADAAHAAGEAAGREARSIGIRLALLTAPPVAPDTVASAIDPRTPAAYDGVLAALGGMRDAGLLVAARAFPAPEAEAGRFPALPWDRAQLDAGALGFVRRFVAAGADGIALGALAAPALTGDSVPLALSPVAVQGDLRRDLAFGGLVITELGRGSPLARSFGEREAAVRAVAAGADLLLGVDDAGGVVDALLGAVRSGRIPPARIDEAVRRVFAAKEKAGLGRRTEDGRAPARDSTPPPAPGVARSAAREAFAASTFAYGGMPGQMLRGCTRPVLVTARGRRADALARALAPREGGGIPALEADSVAARGPLTRDTAFARNDADCVVIARFPGAAPGVAERLAPAPDSIRSPADTARRRLVDAGFASPALPAYAANAQVLVDGTGEDAQAAAARVLAGGAGVDAPRPPASAWPPARTLRRGVAAAAGMDAAKLARVDDIVQKGVEDGVYPGAALAIGRHGVLVRMRGYGHLYGEPGSPRATDTSLYDLASLTKVVATTAAAMAMVDEGRLSLDAPVHRYVSGFHGGDRGDVTIRHLLTHTAGLPPGADLYSESSSPATALQRVLKEPLVYTPGTKMVYSDFSMVLLQAAIEHQAGEPLDRYLAHRVWAPLGMTGTMYLPPLLERRRTAPGALRTERQYVVRGVVHDGNAFRLGGVAGHAGLFSTARDLAVYAQTLLSGGAYGPRRVFSRGVVARFTADQGLPGHRGLGWDKPAAKSSAGALFSSHSWGHTGFTGTEVWVDPDRDLFVVLLTNRTYDTGNEGQIYEVRRKVAEAAALAITDMKVTPRPGALLPPELRPRPAPRARGGRGRGARARQPARTAPKPRRTPRRRP
jgi:beta-N-acetylhexosaminidase